MEMNCLYLLTNWLCNLYVVELTLSGFVIVIHTCSFVLFDCFACIGLITFVFVLCV